MEKFIRIYKEQAYDQALLADISYDLILKNETKPDPLFAHIHHFIIHVSNVMKLIQPNAKDNFRQYDPTKKILYFAGREYNIGRLHKYIGDVIVELKK